MFLDEFVIFLQLFDLDEMFSWISSVEGETLVDQLTECMLLELCIVLQVREQVQLDVSVHFVQVLLLSDCLIELC